MSSRALCLGILTPLVLIASACRDEPVRPGDKAVNASMAAEPGAQEQRPPIEEAQAHRSAPTPAPRPLKFSV